MNLLRRIIRWFTGSILGQQASGGPNEFERLWRGFMTARSTLGLVLVLLHGGIFFLSSYQSSLQFVISVGYFIAALAVRLMAQPQQMGQAIDLQWLSTVGVDIATFTALQVLQGGAINYAPLLALPILMTSVLGSMMMSLAAASGVTLLLFAHAAWLSLLAPGEASTQFSQVALTSTGFFVVSFIASQVASRLANVEHMAQHNRLAVAAQRQVNALVIESLTDGILVVNELCAIRSANPAALRLLGTHSSPSDQVMNLAERPGWSDLLALVHLTFATQSPQRAEISIVNAGKRQRRLEAITQMTARLGNDAPELCVVFVRDQRELQAHLRNEKFASLGRMSAAVAHEIRNPLTAILQANALLEEGLSRPSDQRLSQMVKQNALRLEKIAHDVLYLAHTPVGDNTDSRLMINLVNTIDVVTRDWQDQHGVTNELLVATQPTQFQVWFEPEHLRRVLINLLDNALRYINKQPGCIQISTDFSRAAAPQHEVNMHVWNAGEPLDMSVELHLFEPFFTSESRSSGLGLYICRELCERHAAVISYTRCERHVSGTLVWGNDFNVCLKSRPIVKPVKATLDRTQS